MRSWVGILARHGCAPRCRTSLTGPIENLYDSKARMEPPVPKVTPPPPAKAAKTYALRFISGKYQGGEFPIASDREIYIGRSNELDVVLVEDMVSRKPDLLNDSWRRYAIDWGVPRSARLFRHSPRIPSPSRRTRQFLPRSSNQRMDRQLPARRTRLLHELPSLLPHRPDP